MSTKGTHIPDWLAVPFAGITPAPSQEKGQDLFPTGNWRAIRPVYRDKMPPCNNACGTNEKIQGYLDLVKRGKYLDAYALIKEDMPFPSVTGRVCYHPCEQACNRGKYDEAISIRAVERFLGDLGQALPRDVVKAGPPNGKKVAVVGSGPAGHSAAYQLARLGYAGHDFREVAEGRRAEPRRHSRLGASAGRARSRDRAPRRARHHDQDQHRGGQGRHLGRPEEELRRLRAGRRSHRAEQRARRGRRQGRRALRASVPARHRHGHVHGEAGAARRRHRRRQHRDRLRPRGAAPGRRRSDDDHRRAEPRRDAGRAGRSARHARGGRRADARPGNDRRARQRPRRGAAAPSRPLQRRHQRVADRHRSRGAGRALRRRQRDHRGGTACVAAVAARRIQERARHDQDRSVRTPRRHELLCRRRHRAARLRSAADGGQRCRRRQARGVQSRQSRSAASRCRNAWSRST